MRFLRAAFRDLAMFFNNSEQKSVSSQKIYQFLQNKTIQLIICSPKLLIGVNLSKFHITIKKGPYERALGRIGRREEGGQALSILYNCWNKTNLGRNTSSCMIDFCLARDCLKTFSPKFFTGEDRTFGGDWCCSTCDAVYFSMAHGGVQLALISEYGVVSPG